MRISLLKNTVMNYAWGSTTFIPELLGLPPSDDTPAAELWMGAHPKAPSTVQTESGDHPLSELTKTAPEVVLGRPTAADFGRRFPFLFKILAADRPLSIQAHPDRKTAVEGYQRESAAEIPLDDPRRNYRDENSKPEMIAALTPFYALCGFRKPAEIESSVASLKNELPDLLDHSLSDTTATEPERLKRFFTRLLTLPEKTRYRAVQTAQSAATKKNDPVSAWIRRLATNYPNDIGVLSPLFLNLVTLSPGDALFLGPGAPHAYLSGAGVELMGASDNVVRGGLTPKHVDVPELLRVLDFMPFTPAVLFPRRISEWEAAYPKRADEFQLSVVTVTPERPADFTPTGVEILIALEGSLNVTEADKKTLSLQKGDAFLVPGAVSRYRVTGDATLYKAFVPAATQD